MDVHHRTEEERDADLQSARRWVQGMAIPRTPIEPPTDRSYKPIKIKPIKFTGCSCPECKERRK